MRFNIINIFGLIIMLIILIPNIIYAFSGKQIKNNYKNKALNILEQIGRYGTMVLMIFNIGLPEFGFWAKSGFVIWVIFIPALILLYLIVWVLYFKIPKKASTWFILLAIIPGVIFILHGILLRHVLLCIFGAVFSAAHIVITYKNCAS